MCVIYNNRLFRTYIRIFIKLHKNTKNKCFYNIQIKYHSFMTSIIQRLLLIL